MLEAFLRQIADSGTTGQLHLAGINIRLPGQQT